MSWLIRQRKNKKNKEGKENKKISGKTDYNEDELTYSECLAGALAEREHTEKLSGALCSSRASTVAAPLLDMPSGAITSHV